MFGVDSTELAVVAILALIFIGPKDLPKVLRTVGYWVGRVRGMARHFTSGIENMMREAELEEMEKKWREENERIMQLHPADAHYPEPGQPACGCRCCPLRRRAAGARGPPARKAAAAVKDIDETKQPLLEHLIELRRRLAVVPGDARRHFLHLLLLRQGHLRGARPAAAQGGPGQAHLHRHFRGLLRPGEGRACSPR